VRGRCAWRTGVVATSVIVAEIFRRALDEAGSEEADGYRYGGHGCRATAHHVLEFVEEIGEGALADRFRQLLQAFGGAVDDGADVGALVEGPRGLAQGVREIRDRCRDVVLAAVGIIGRLLTRRIDEIAAALHGGAGNVSDIAFQRIPILGAIVLLAVGVLLSHAHGRPLSIVSV
jgi:hypothetical protein